MENNQIDDNKIELENGSVKISDEVVSVLAGLAVNEVKGISVINSIADGIVEKLVRKNYGKGIRVIMTDDTVTVEVHISVEYGVKIPDVAWELQETVKKNIETMTDLKVLGVNVFVEGITPEKTLPQPKKVKKVREKALKEEPFVESIEEITEEVTDESAPSSLEEKNK